MQSRTRFQLSPKGPIMADVGVPLLATALLWNFTLHDVTLAETGLAFLLAWLTWASYRNWYRGERKGIPFFTLIAGMYWLAYVPPLFLGSHEVILVSGRRLLSDRAITAALCLAVAGVVALAVGFKLAANFRWSPRIRVDVADTPGQWQYLRTIFIVGALVKVFVPITEWGEGGRQFIYNFENLVPTVSFAIFLRYYLRRGISDVDKCLMVAYLFVGFVVGMSSGWLGSFVGLGVVCVIVYAYERRKLPVTAALIVVPIILFFQPAKTAFRERYWKEGSTDSYSERITFWVQSSWNMWSDAITDRTGRQGKHLTDATLTRLSLLEQTANVMEFTPGRVPYQYGSLYSYLGVTLIPRFLWPDKPSVNDANRWYQVSYGLTLPHGLSNVSIAVGSLAESYINFGWLGPVLIMLPLGFFLGYLQRVCLHAESGMLLGSMGAVLVPQLLAVESQMAQYVGGLAQQFLVVLAVLIPILKAQRRKKSVPARVFARSANQPNIFRPSTSPPKPPL